MHPYPSVMLMTGGTVSFVGQSTSQTPAALTYPGGAQAGDLAVVFCASAASISGWGAGETQGDLRMLSRFLSAGDISAPASVAGGAQFCLQVYRGPVRVEKRGGVSQGAVPPLVIPGFTRFGGPGLVVAHRTSINNSAGVVPAGWLRRVNNLNDTGFTSLTTADLLSPGGYVSGTDLTINNSGPSGAGDALVAEFV